MEASFEWSTRGSNLACSVADGAHDATVHMCACRSNTLLVTECQTSFFSLYSKLPWLSRCGPIRAVLCRYRHELLEMTAHGTSYNLLRAAEMIRPAILPHIQVVTHTELMI